MAVCTSAIWCPAHYLALRHIVTRQLLAENGGAYSVPLPHHSLNCLLIGNPNGDLVSADTEVESLLDLLQMAPQPTRVEFLCRDHASKMRVMAALASGDYDLIHFACHARPGALGLADGWVDAGEIQTVLRGRPMVVLNACTSGRTPAEQQQALPFAGQQVHGLALRPATDFRRSTPGRPPPVARAGEVEYNGVRIRVESSRHGPS